ncbi:tetratricopeptide (TPR) repeat protein [Phytomonospora endophytica]|uniref:Tetratricopeptide (TPR) repeat protein n=1 Tax=Phytomonospora endophytica TaxID=714109 RepID=A0A841FNC9_9ACTN|nr:tetratricopeptide (TPR) repeat protein [Phytomonospora endophytica]
MAPRVLVTAWHVLSDIGAADIGVDVPVDALRGDAPVRMATVARIDPPHDLAVLVAEEPLAASVAGIFASDAVDRLTDVVVTGVSDVDDFGHGWSSLDATGRWQGGAARDDGVSVGRVAASAVMRGMSGAPVRRVSDDKVVGVVSARYNSADGWLRDTVWIARTEHLVPLLEGLAELDLDGRLPLGNSVDVTIRVSDTEVRLIRPDGEVTGEHGGVRPALSGAIHDLSRARARVGGIRAGGSAVAAAEADATALVRRVGELLAASFLPQPIATGLRELLSRAEAEHLPVRIGVEAPFALPWETLILPGAAAALALHPLVAFYRKASAGPVRELPGPLRMVVAISAPETGGGPLLDYERELRNVLASVRGARQGDAHVTVVPFASTKAIRAALADGGVHILHLSAHGAPGFLDLEDDDGDVRRVDADTLVDEAVPAGCMPPVIALSACHTDAVGADGASLAARLMRRGATAVIGTETSVTDRYATWLFARVYTELASSSRPDVVRAVADARRLVHRDLAGAVGAIDRDIAGLEEWGAITVQSATPELHVYDPAAPARPVPRLAAGPVEGLLSRPVGEFVGRRREQRRLPDALTGASAVAGVVLHGIGGIGKTTLAAELTRLVPEREPGRLVVALTGSSTVDGILAAVAGKLRRHLMLSGEHTGPAVEAVGIAGRLDVEWGDRFEVLREHALSRIPLLLVLDNAEDNLVAADGGWEFADPTVAGLLAAWASSAGTHRLLVTSRYPFALPESAHENLVFHHLGPMTLAETQKLLWALPGLDGLDTGEVERVWRLVGGHPRTLEYLDALLAGGSARFPDISRRLSAAAEKATGGRKWLAQTRTLDTALAETVTLAADDVLLGELLEGLTAVEGALEVLIGASVHREPVELKALRFQVGEEIDLERIVRALADSSLLSFSEDTGEVFVHRWTATVLHEGRDLEAAHRGAAEYRLWRVEERAQDERADLHDCLEARHHLYRAGYVNDATHVTGDICRQLHVWGAWDHEAALIHETLAALPDADGQREAWLHQLGLIAHERGDLDEAMRRYLASMAIAERFGNDQGIAASLHQLGIVAEHHGRLDEAEGRYRSSLDICERLGDRAGIARGTHQLGAVAHLRGDLDEAERLYRVSLTIKEELGDEGDISVGFHQLGILAEQRGDLDEAEHRHSAALAISERRGDKGGIARATHQLGVVVQRRGDLDEAERLYRASLTIKEQLGYPLGIASSTHQLGVIASLRGDFDEAERHHSVALEIAERIGDQDGMAVSVTSLGLVAANRDDLDTAMAMFVRAFTLRSTAGLRPAMETRGLAYLHEDLGEDRFRTEALKTVDPETLALILAAIEDPP